MSGRWRNYRNSEGYPDPTASAAIENIAREERRLRGMQSRIDGGVFEEMIERSCSWYHSKGIAFIEKTPEPMKPLSHPNRQGQFKACFIRAGQPDFKGTLQGGRAIVFEAKHTAGDRIDYNRLTDEQIMSLSDHDALGAEAFVMVSFRLQNFYRIPWLVWSDMKRIYGRKHLKEAELGKYQLKCTSGVIQFLDGLEEEA